MKHVELPPVKQHVFSPPTVESTEFDAAESEAVTSERDTSVEVAHTDSASVKPIPGQHGESAPVADPTHSRPTDLGPEETHKTPETNDDSPDAERSESASARSEKPGTSTDSTSGDSNAAAEKEAGEHGAGEKYESGQQKKSGDSKPKQHRRRRRSRRRKKR